MGISERAELCQCRTSSIACCQCRVAAFIAGIKYLLASRPETAEQLLPAALPVLLAGLTDKDDSVQAAAADALVPMAPLLLAMQDDMVRGPTVALHGCQLRSVQARLRPGSINQQT